MSRLTWDSEGERFYEIGVDHGVLFVGIEPGVPWTGLISVSESPTGGEAKPLYFDGIKYINISEAEEFEATLEAFGSPSQFDPCDGILSFQNGLFATQQPRKSFGLSYRTKVGNDVEGIDHGYKIHLIYNALASPSQRSNATLSDSSQPIRLSWNISTRAPELTWHKRTAHFVIDSRLTSNDILVAVEDILYGTEVDESRLPSPSELIAIFDSFVIIA